MIKKLEEKIIKGKKLAEEFRAMGIQVDFNEETGEITIQGEQLFNK